MADNSQINTNSTLARCAYIMYLDLVLYRHLQCL